MQSGGPYILSPSWARIVQRVLYAARYVLLVGAGYIAWNIAESGRLHVIGAALVLFGLVALFGVLSRRFQFELVALWFVIAALLGAVLILVTASLYTSSLLVAALIPGLAARLLYLTLLARRARES